MDRPKVTIKAKRKILKYAEGVDPEKGQPFEVVEKQDVFKGQEAEKILEELGANPTRRRDKRWD